jgi:tetratricopeptide (TPR) repeat protein
VNRKLLAFLSRGQRRAMIGAADAARDAGDRVTAARLYGELAERFPDFFGAWVQRGNMLKDESLYDDAEAAYRQALTLKPGDADVHVQMGHLAKLRGNPRAALELYRQAEILDPTSEAAKREIAALGFAGSAAEDKEALARLDHDPELGETAALLHRRLHLALASRRA